MKYRKKIKNRLIFMLIKGVALILQLLPRKAALLFMKGVGWCAYYGLREARATTIENLTMAYHKSKSLTEIKVMSREVFVNLGRNIVDVIRLQKLIKHGIDHVIQAQGIDKLDRAWRRGQAVILVGGHLGSWELIAAYLAVKGYPLAVLAKPLYDPRLNQMLVQNRENAGFKSIPRDSGLKQTLQWLRRGNILGILIDQDTNVHGEFVDFYGRKAYTPSGPVILAQHTGATILPVAIHIREDDTHLIEFGHEIQLQNTGVAKEDRTENVARCSKAVESFIRRNPTQWVWMHRRWKTQPSEIYLNDNLTQMVDITNNVDN
jgi:KDO2-lipid IV(A) lauroyltransferase